MSSHVPVYSCCFSWLIRGGRNYYRIVFEFFRCFHLYFPLGCKFLLLFFLFLILLLHYSFLLHHCLILICIFLSYFDFFHHFFLSCRVKDHSIFREPSPPSWIVFCESDAEGVSVLDSKIKSVGIYSINHHSSISFYTNSKLIQIYIFLFLVRVSSG